jgi:hypothetical protein
MNYDYYITLPTKKTEALKEFETRVCNLYQEYFLDRYYKKYKAGTINGKELHKSNGDVTYQIYIELKEDYPLRLFNQEKVRGILLKHRLYVSTYQLAKPEPRPIFNWRKYKEEIVPREIEALFKYVSSMRGEIKAYMSYLQCHNPNVTHAELTFLNSVISNNYRIEG